MLTRFVALAISLFCAATAVAHGPTPQTVTETITINASPSQVWALISDFGALQSWHPSVVESDGNGNAVGNERTVKLKTGVITDSIDEYDAKSMSYSYRLAKENVEAFPVSFYSSTIAVKPAAGGSIVEWLGRFYRADTGNYPPENLNDAAATKAMTDFFRDGLAGLREKVEAGQ